jgi:AcrR family transcriptional regulator
MIWGDRMLVAEQAEQEEVATTRPRGRPRSVSADERILHAARGELADVGYDGLKFRRVAERAGVARSTLYRRWNTKLVLAMDVATDIIERHTPPNLGDATIDLETALDDAVFSVNHGPDGRCVAALAAESVHNPELAEHCVLRLDVPRRDQIRTVLQRGIQQGDVREDLDMETTIDLLVSVVPYHLMFSGHTMPGDYGRRVVAAVMAGAAPTGDQP